MSEISLAPEQDFRQEAVVALASALHEDWRKSRLREDGSFEPRVEATEDEAWIESHGTDQVDIANTLFAELPADWQAENYAAAQVVVTVISGTNRDVDLNDPVQRENIGSKIHIAWLARNDWAAGGELDVPFSQLSAAEQAKDINQVVIAQQVFQQ